MTTREQQAKERLANIVVKMTLEGDIEAADAALETLATFDNVQRLPGSDGQPGFGRGWGYGDPYDEAGYGRAAPTRHVPNTGDLPTSFDEYAEDDEEEESGKVADILEAKEKKKDDDEDVEKDPDDAHFEADDFDLDVAFASVVQKVSAALGEKASTEFSELFGIFGAQQGVEKIAESDDDDDDDDDDDEEEVEVEELIPEKKPRNKREVIQVWREDLIPDISPIIKRVLKHVSVQYSLPYSTLIDALRGQDSQVADLLADSLER